MLGPGSAGAFLFTTRGVNANTDIRDAAGGVCGLSDFAGVLSHK